MLEIIKSFVNTNYERIKNPFSGTLLLVLAIYHWKVIYSVLTFDSILTIDERIAVIENYIESSSFSNGLILPVVWTFTIIIFYLVLNEAARALVLLKQNKLEVFINKLLSPKHLVTIERYSQLESAYNFAQLKIESLKKENVDAVSDSEKYVAEKTRLQEMIEISNSKAFSRYEKKPLNSFFSGTWRNDYIDVSKSLKPVKEPFKLHGDEYYVLEENFSETLAFTVKNCMYDSLDSILYFEKVKDGALCRNLLKKVTEDKFVGVELAEEPGKTQGVIIEYHRIPA